MLTLDEPLPPVRGVPDEGGVPPGDDLLYCGGAGAALLGERTLGSMAENKQHVTLMVLRRCNEHDALETGSHSACSLRVKQGHWVEQNSTCTYAQHSNMRLY